MFQPISPDHGRRCARNRVALRVEELEHRAVPATMTVNTDADSVTPNNVLSLREAIMLTDGTLALNALTAQEKMQVNGIPGGNQPDTVLFNLPGPDLAIVEIDSLPAITHPTTIDGFSQPGAAPDTAPFGQPSNAIYKIAVVGANVEEVGFNIEAGGSGTVIRGLSIINFAGAAITLQTNGNTVEQNSIGIDPTGKVFGNGGKGAVFVNDVSDNLIRNNLISGNRRPGLFITGEQAQDNRVQGNYIGTDAKGQNPVPNADNGVVIAGGATDNLIGGSVTFGQGNVISGNTGNGVLIRDGSNGNDIQGNLIGTDWTGTTAVGNGVAGGDSTFNRRNGVSIDESPGNLIGGATQDLGNLISGNNQNGIQIDGEVAVSNVIQGSYIGTNYTGSATLGNGADGVQINGAGTPDAPIQIGGLAPVTGQAPGNLISGNVGNGVSITADAEGDNGIWTLIQGNLIGTDETGLLNGFGNRQAGVLLTSTKFSMIGGAQPALGNVISGNQNCGVHMEFGSNNLVENNYIGTDMTGTQAIGNLMDGVFLDASHQNRIGIPGAGNVISGNMRPGGLSTLHGSGVFIELADLNLVQGNYIGTDASGKNVLGNTGCGVNVAGAASNGNLVGGVNQGEGNTIGGNTAYGVFLAGEYNSVEGNIIGGTSGKGSPIPNGRGAGQDAQGLNNSFGERKRNQVVYNLNGGLELDGQGAIVGDDIESNGGIGLRIAGGTGINVGGATIINNAGTDVDTVSGSATFAGGNTIGQFLQESATIKFQGTNSLANFTQTGGSTEVDGTLAGTASSRVVESGGSLVIYGSVNVAATFSQSGGTASLLGGTVAAPGGLTIGSGSAFSGYGTIYGSVTNQGTLWVGSPTSAAYLTINGAFTQQSSGLLEMDLFAPHTNGALNVTGAATLGGTLQLNLENGYSPAVGDQFMLLHYASESGQFGSLNLPTLASGAWSVTYNSPYGLMLNVV